MTPNCPSPKLLKYPRINLALSPVPCYLGVLQNSEPESSAIILNISAPPPKEPTECLSVGELFYHHGVIMHPSRFPAWRLTEMKSATIKGQPYLGCCTLVATDGVHGFVITPAKNYLFRIHITNFEGRVLPRGGGGSKYKAKGEEKKHETRADRMSKKADELFKELGI